MKLSAQSTVALTIVIVASATAGTLWMADREDAPPSETESDGIVSSLSEDELNELVASAREACAGEEDQSSCLQDRVLDFSKNDGPVQAIKVLSVLIASGEITGKSDYHDFVHKIGRNTAKKFGLNPDAFFSCPDDYNYGCQHGFFEQALVQEPSAKRAAEIVCDPKKMGDLPLKFLFYCYHGVGHGIMMAKAYDLKASLDLCDEFSGHDQSEGCYQGVFMENVVGYQNGTARTNAFSEGDKLQPCRDLDQRFHQQCYMNHGGYLAMTAGSGPGAIERATVPCLSAGSAQDISDCLQSVGLNATNPGWQQVLAPAPTNDFIETGVQICHHFPEGYVEDCVIAGINNLANFDKADTTNMTAFCLAMDNEYHSVCFRQVGAAVHHEVTANTLAEQACQSIPEEYRDECIAGFRL